MSNLSDIHPLHAFCISQIQNTKYKIIKIGNSEKSQIHSFQKFAFDVQTLVEQVFLKIQLGQSRRIFEFSMIIVRIFTKVFLVFYQMYLCKLFCVFVSGMIKSTASTADAASAPALTILSKRIWPHNSRTILSRRNTT